MKTTSNLFLAIFFFMGLKSCNFVDTKDSTSGPEEDTQMAEATNG